MYNLFYDKQTGAITRFFNGPEFTILEQLQANEDYIEVEDMFDTSTSYIDVLTKEIVNFPARVNRYQEFNWADKQWEYPVGYLELAKEDAKTEVNKVAGFAILTKYPTYRQINYNREPDSPTTIEMNLWIDGVRAESNIATSSIDSATDLAAIEGIVDGFKAYLESL